MTTFPRLTVEELLARFSAPRTEVDETVARVVADVRLRGELAVREYAERFDGLEPGAALIIDRQAMRAALDDLAFEARERLTRIALRIRRFAEQQRESLLPMSVAIPGGTAGHGIAPVQRAGCYAPGGRYPLPSSLLMTAITARAAGVSEVWIASPKSHPIMLACGALADADGFVVAGGAQAIAALAFGAGPIPSCDMIVGPGNAYVTSAKRLVAGQVGIDALAGPSELLIIADDIADPALVAADLLAQAEHDPWSIPILVTWSDRLIREVECELDRQLTTLPTAEVARAALSNGGAILVRHANESATVSDAVAPEHLHLHVEHPDALAALVRNYGALFIGGQSAEVLGDYGAGPNHVLPTGRAARFSGGLSVFSFLRVRTWLSVDDEHAARRLYEDAAWLARCEGLEAHARSSEARLTRARVKA